MAQIEEGVARGSRTHRFDYGPRRVERARMKAPQAGVVEPGGVPSPATGRARRRCEGQEGGTNRWWREKQLFSLIISVAIHHSKSVFDTVMTDVDHFDCNPLCGKFQEVR